MAIKYFIVILHSVFCGNLNNCSNNRDTTKITVVGRAVEIKLHAGVKTDDSLIYYLEGVIDWDVKYLGKRVKVTGYLVPVVPPVLKIPGSNVTPQPRLRDGRYLKKAKWRLVK